MTDLEKARSEVEALVKEWLSSGYLKKGSVFVIGCSTSEVAGERIGTAGSEEIAAVIYESVQALARQAGVHLAFQCCEHLNRALVIEMDLLEQDRSFTQVTAIPVPKAGGSMASYAYKQMKKPVLVEFIKADAGLDIGETMIGMHLKHVAVPLRLKQKSIGHARVNAARVRPKLIGGERASYPEKEDAGTFCD